MERPEASGGFGDCNAASSTSWRRCAGQAPRYALSPSRLSDLLMVSRAGMVNRLDRLASAGMIERSLDRADRRGFQIRLTDQGYATVDAATTQCTASVTALLAGLTPRELTALARKLLHQPTTPA